MMNTIARQQGCRYQVVNDLGGCYGYFKTHDAACERAEQERRRLANDRLNSGTRVWVERI